MTRPSPDATDSPSADDWAAFRAYAMARAPLSEADWVLTQQRFRPVSFEARARLLSVGQVCTELYYLASGYLRYYVRGGGGTISKYFTWPDQIFTAVESFTFGRPSTEGIEALSPVRAFAISYADLQALFAEAPAWSQLIRVVQSEVFAAAEGLALEAASGAPEQRYRRLLEQSPELIALLEVQELASYLGIAPESLSRIRRRLARGG